ncbi:MAG: hypothetical protein O7D91_16940 [Planctomycetota bacterium]|nr:hypothetical protein [Planctomycetota bacterium]
MISDALSVVGKALDVVGKLREAKIKDAETRNLIADLNIALADIKMKFAEAGGRITELEGQLSEARKIPDLRSRLRKDKGVYFFKEQVEDYPHEGPYCPRCFDVEGRLVTVQELPKDFRNLARFVCANCKGSW